MTRQPPSKPAYDTERLRRDLAVKGWIPQDLANKAGVSHMSVSRFLRGERQTPRIAKKLSRALGHPADHYLLPEAA